MTEIHIDCQCKHIEEEKYRCSKLVKFIYDDEYSHDGYVEVNISNDDGLFLNKGILLKKELFNMEMLK